MSVLVLILICLLGPSLFAQDFDSQEYATSGQRHAATLEHGQREVRAIIGSVLLSQLRAAWHQQTAHAQSEHYLFALAMQAIRTQLASATFGAKEHRRTSLAKDDGKGLVVLSAASAAEMAATRLLEEVEEEEGEAAARRKNKSRKKKERKARAKLRKAAGGGSCSSSVACDSGGLGEGDDEEGDVEGGGGSGGGQVEERPQGAPQELATRGENCTGLAVDPDVADGGAPGGHGSEERPSTFVAQEQPAGYPEGQVACPGLRRCSHVLPHQAQACDGRSPRATTGALGDVQVLRGEPVQGQERGCGGGGEGASEAGLCPSCYDAAAEERLLRTLWASGGGRDLGERDGISGGFGGVMSLEDQLAPEEEEEEGLDDALLQEMAKLKTSLSGEADRREQLRSRLARNFKQWCLAADRDV